MHEKTGHTTAETNEQSHGDPKRIALIVAIVEEQSMTHQQVSWCPVCKSSVFSEDIISTLGDMVTMRCSKCAQVFFATISRLPEMKLDKLCVLKPEWQTGKPSIKELSAIRKTIPGYQRVPMSKLLDKFKSNPHEELGEYVQGEAMDIQRAAAVQGLKLSLVVKE